MNLERLEELCLRQLRQAKNPLVSVSQLLEYCRRDEACTEASEEELLSFLRAHSEVRVIEGGAAGVEADVLAGLDLDVGTKAILSERVPTQDDLSQMMGAEMSRITDALQQLAGAMEDEDGGDARVAQLKEMMSRAETLKTRIQKLP